MKFRIVPRGSVKDVLAKNFMEAVDSVFQDFSDIISKHSPTFRIEVLISALSEVMIQIISMTTMKEEDIHDLFSSLEEKIKEINQKEGYSG
jgi:hypothetical protein